MGRVKFVFSKDPFGVGVGDELGYEIRWEITVVIIQGGDRKGRGQQTSCSRMSKVVVLIVLT